MKTRQTILLTVVALALGVLTAKALEGRDVAADVLRGRVVDASGRALSYVWISRVGDKSYFGGPRQTRTDLEGRFELPKAPGKKFELKLWVARSQTRASYKGRFDAASHKIVFDPGPTLTVRVADYVPPKGEHRTAHLTWPLADGKRTRRYAPIHADGTIHFLALPKDKPVELWTVADTGRPVHVPKLVAGAKPVEVNSVRGETITGRVAIATGESMSRVSLRAYAYPSFRVGRVTTNPTGEFVISDLPPGTYTLSAHFSMGEVSMPVTVKARGGDRGVTLDLTK